VRQLITSQHGHEAGSRPPGLVLHLAVDYKKQIGFTGTFYIERQAEGAPSISTTPTPTVLSLTFLRTYDCGPFK